MTEKEVLEAFESDLNENEVNAMGRKSIKEPLWPIKTIFSKNKINVLQNTDRRKDTRDI